MRRLHIPALILTLFLGCGVHTPDSEAYLEAAPEQEQVQDIAADPTQEAFAEAMTYARAEKLHEQPIGQIMQEVGVLFKGRRYVAGILDDPVEEVLTCRLDGFDCVTFVESTLALARGIMDQDYAFSSFEKYIEDQRYRDGKLDGHCSRLHYFSEWILDNERRGNVENITAEIGGIPLDKTLNFMTTNRSSYPQLADDEAFACIQEMEESLADLQIYYIPEDDIRSVYSKLQAGDIIATATNVKGIDVTHTGLVYDNSDGTKGFLHASTSGGVKISPDLQKYIQGNRNQIGIIVARPLG